MIIINSQKSFVITHNITENLEIVIEKDIGFIWIIM